MRIDIGCSNFIQAFLRRAHQHDTDPWWQAMEWRRDHTNPKNYIAAGVPVAWDGIQKGEGQEE